MSSPGLENKLTFKMLLLQFSNINTYNQQFNELFFSNPGDKVLILVESRGQICPNVFTLFWILSSGLEKNDTLKCSSCIFQTILT